MQLGLCWKLNPESEKLSAHVLLNLRMPLAKISELNELESNFKQGLLSSDLLTTKKDNEKYHQLKTNIEELDGNEIVDSINNKLLSLTSLLGE